MLHPARTSRTWRIMALACRILPALLWCLPAPAAGGQPMMVWPTPHTGFADGRSYEAFIQPTVSGRPESGLFGCVRSDGAQFHEGLDIVPVDRDRRGEPLDPVYCALPGVVRHINARPGNSSYGCYVVVEHTEMTPAIITLYAHLSKIAPGLTAGARVAPGDVLGTMGHTGSGGIPKSRAHLHFEMGVYLTDNFQAWYDRQGFSTPNRQGRFNGMNIQGFDPLDFYQRVRDRTVDDVIGYLAMQEPAVRVRVRRQGVPDFAARYPSLVRGGIPDDGPAGWEVGLTCYGFPVEWRPLAADELGDGRSPAVQITWTDEAALRQARCCSLVVTRGRSRVPGRNLERILQLLFGIRQ